MKAFDLSKVNLIKFNIYYLALSAIYLLISSRLELRFFPNPELFFTIGLMIGLGIQFSFLNLRINIMKSDIQKSGNLQMMLSFLSIVINVIALIILLSFINNFSLVFGFFIAHNLNILNIALITNRSTKKDD